MLGPSTGTGRPVHATATVPAPIGRPELAFRTPAASKRSTYAPGSEQREPSPDNSNAVPAFRGDTVTPDRGTAAPSRVREKRFKPTSPDTIAAEKRSTARSTVEPSAMASHAAVAGTTSTNTSSSVTYSFPAASSHRTASDDAPVGNVTARARFVPPGANGLASTSSCPSRSASTVTCAVSAARVARTVTDASHVTPSVADSPRSGSMRSPIATGAVVSRIHVTLASAVHGNPLAPVANEPTTVRVCDPSLDTQPSSPATVQQVPVSSAVTVTPSTDAPSSRSAVASKPSTGTENTTVTSPTQRTEAPSSIPSNRSTDGATPLATDQDTLRPPIPRLPFVPAMPTVRTTSS